MPVMLGDLTAAIGGSEITRRNEQRTQAGAGLDLTKRVPQWGQERIEAS